MLAAPFATKIPRIDMALIDEAVFNLIKLHRDTSGYSTIKGCVIAATLHCHINTVSTATRRLEHAGRIRKVRVGGRAGNKYEVLNDQPTGTSKPKHQGR